MMEKVRVESLHEEAERLARKQGHTVVWDEVLIMEDFDTQQAHCILCECWIEVRSKPYRWGKYIGGPAAGLKCPASGVLQ